MTQPDTTIVKLDQLHSAINQCRSCETLVAGFCKPKHLDRGFPGRTMIIGQGPGNTEVEQGRAFAGQSGKTLDGWLVRSGALPAHPRRGIYLTAVIKCVGEDSEYAVMAGHCRGFLYDQITLIHPELIITLGKRSFDTLTFTSLSYEDALCTPLRTSEHVLVTPYGFHFSAIHWPHPSGLNRWLNESANRDRLELSFRFVGSFLEVMP